MIVEISKIRNVERYGKVPSMKIGRQGDKILSILPYSDTLVDKGISPLLFVDEYEIAKGENGKDQKIKKIPEYKQFVGFREENINLSNYGVDLSGVEGDGTFSNKVFDDIIKLDLYQSGLANDETVHLWERAIVYPLFTKGQYILIPGFMEKDIHSLSDVEREIAKDIFIKMCQMFVNDVQVNLQENGEILTLMKAGYIPIFEQFGSDAFQAMKTRIYEVLREIPFTPLVNGKRVEIKEKLVKSGRNIIMVSVPFVEAIIGRIEGVPVECRRSGTFTEYLRYCIEEE